MSFEQKLAAFEPALATFLRQAWEQRARVDLNTENGAYRDLYSIYTGPDTPLTAYDPKRHKGQLRAFIDKLKQLDGGKRAIEQESEVFLHEIDDDYIYFHGPELWITFFHFYPATPASGLCRVYIHATTTDAALGILEAAVGWLDRIAGMAEIKIVAPGDMQRPDTLVAWMANETAREAFLVELRRLKAAHADWFTDPLPGLVKRLEAGIGVANEPPRIPITVRGSDRHSFGTWYSLLAWLALKTTPNVRTPGQGDGRHFLDNMLWSFRVLGIDPKNHHQFPAREQLEALQRTHPASA